MPICITSVHIVVVVLPVPCSRIVGWIDIDTVHLTSIEILQQLQGMVIVRFDQCMPKVAVRRIADRVDRLQIRINWLAKFRNGNKIIQSKLCLCAKDTIDDRIMKALSQKERTQTALIDAVKANLKI